MNVAWSQCAMLAGKGVRSNLFMTLGRGLDKGLGEVHNTYFPLQPESVAPRAGKGIQAV